MTQTQDNLEEIIKALDSVKTLLDHLKEVGREVRISPAALDALEKSGGGPFAMHDRAAESHQVSAKPPKAGETPPVVTKTPPVVYETPPEIHSLEDVQTWIGDCRRCGLCEGRSQVVFGAGNPTADLMFIGEGPGAQEDLQGMPFVGAAGQLLTKMIEGGLKKSREDVFITNIVKCRPPGNRDPLPDEAAACRPFLMEQIRLVAPKVICTLGRISTQDLLETTVSISKLRGTWQEFNGIRLLPTFHPAALLRNPSHKRPVWEDLKLIMSELRWDWQ